MDVSVFDNTVVLDNGTGTVKAGLAKDSLPSVTTPTVVGRTHKQNIVVGLILKDSYVGDEAQGKRGILTLRYPIEHGIVTNWEDMETIWHHIFNKELNVDSSAHRLLVTDSPQTCTGTRQKMAEVMFETFNIPSMYIANEAIMSLGASGSTTGLILHSGYSHTYVLPIYEGYALQHLLLNSKMGGDNITDYLIRLLSDRGCPILTTNRSSAERTSLDRIKNDMTCLKRVNALLSSDSPPKVDKYSLPDGSIITIKDERYECPELMFKPSLGGGSDVNDSIHVMVHKTLQKCDDDLLTNFISNITLTGGNTLFPGLGERVKEELTTLVSPTLSSHIRVISPLNRHVSSWIGGALVAKLPVFDRSSMFIRKAEYTECGPDIVVKKWPI